MKKITQAVISAGGRGTRLAPFTDRTPKPMIPVLGKPIMEWHVEQYKKHGVTDFIFLLGYLPQIIIDYFGDGSKFGVSIRYHHEDRPLGSIGNLATLEDIDSIFYFIYGDVFSLIDYTAMAQTFADKKDSIGMERVGETSNPDGNVAVLDEDRRFLSIHGKSDSHSLSAAYNLRGAFILAREIVSYIEPNVPNDLARDLLPRLIAAGKNFYGYECDDYSKGIDTLAKRDEVGTYLKENNVTPWW